MAGTTLHTHDRTELPRSGLFKHESQTAYPELGPRAIATAFVVAIAYYAGAKLGLTLTFPPDPIAILWPPNAILFAGLLLAPTRIWWLLILATFPAHLMAELQGGVPLAMVLCWFVSNVSEASVGALLMRRFGPVEPHTDPVRSTLVFMVFGAFLAPLLASFLDAAFVTLIGWGSVGYWELVTNRFPSNVLATLTIVPVVLAWSMVSHSARTTSASWSMLEAGVLFTALLAACFFVFDARPAGVSSPALLYLPLPFLLWAALRFGMPGTCVAFMITSFLVIWGAAHGRGPLVFSQQNDDTLLVQLFLISVAVPLYALTAVLTGRKESEAALRASEERYRESDERFNLVLAATQDVVYDWHIPAGTLWFNSNGVGLFGDVWGHAQRHPIFWSNAIDADDRQRLSAQLSRLLESGGEKWNAEYRVRRGDGSYAYVNERSFVVRHGEGAPLRMIGSLIDVTDRKRADEASEGLAHASRLAVVGQLTASVAHELNQPLGAILTNLYSANMLLETKPLRIEELRQTLDDIRKDDIRAAEIIKHIRTLLRKREMVMQPFDLNRTISDVLGLASADLTRRHIIVRTDFAPLPVVHGDHVHIQQVVLNLILNGADAMSGSAGARLLDVRTARTSAGGVEVSISDSGVGISAEHIEKLFESFFTTKEEGTGLGLSIARTIVESHGGTIWAEARAQGGMSFHFTMPMNETRAQPLERSWT